MRMPTSFRWLAFAVLLSGCGNIRAITAHTLDCDDDDLWVSEEVGFGPGAHDWTAKCRKDEYDCHASGGIVTCRPHDKKGESKSYVLPPPAPPPR